MALLPEILFSAGRRFAKVHQEVRTSPFAEVQRHQAETFSGLIDGCLNSHGIRHGSIPHERVSALHFNRIDLGYYVRPNGEKFYYFREDNQGADGTFGTDWYIGDRNRLIHKRLSLTETLSLASDKITGRSVSGEELQQVRIKVEKINDIFGGKSGSK